MLTSSNAKSGCISSPAANADPEHKTKLAIIEQANKHNLLRFLAANLIDFSFTVSVFWNFRRWRQYFNISTPPTWIC